VKVVAKSVGVVVRNPKWTSYGALELDVFCPTEADLETYLAATRPILGTEFVTNLNLAPEHLTDYEILSKARGLFNTERYWECHEVLEGLWRQRQGDEKRMLQGMILVCAAYVHHQKGEEGVALGVLVRGAKLLESSVQRYGAFDLSKVRNEVQRRIESGTLTGFRI
jgi:hypothetical protein